VPEQIRWSASQKRAWWFAQSAQERGLSARAALREYRAGGGHIGTDYWFQLYRGVRWVESGSESIMDLPEFYKIPETFMLDVPFRYRQEYVYTAHIYGIDPETGLPAERHVTVESDNPLNRIEILQGAQEAIKYTVGTPPFIVTGISSIHAYHRVGV